MFFLKSSWKLPYNPVDTGRKLKVHKTFRRRAERLLNVLCTFNLCPVSTGNLILIWKVQKSNLFLQIGINFFPSSSDKQSNSNSQKVKELFHLYQSKLGNFFPRCLLKCLAKLILAWKIQKSYLFLSLFCLFGQSKCRISKNWNIAKLSKTE